MVHRLCFFDRQEERTRTPERSQRLSEGPGPVDDARENLKSFKGRHMMETIVAGITPGTCDDSGR
jgi:hypothetical protein